MVPNGKDKKVNVLREKPLSGFKVLQKLVVRKISGEFIEVLMTGISKYN